MRSVEWLEEELTQMARKKEEKEGAIVLNTCPMGLAFKTDGRGEDGGHKYGGASRV
jgi:hypothetical protein